MSIYWYEKRSKWCYAFNVNKQRYTGYCDHPTTGEHAKNKTEARKIENLIKAEVQKKLENPEEAEPLPKVGFTLAEPLSYYLKKLEDKACFASARSYTDELLTFFGGETPMEDVEDRIDEYIAYSKKQKVRFWAGRDENGNDIFKERDKFRSPKTINEYLAHLQRSYKVFKKGQKKDIRKYVPAPPEYDPLETEKRIPTPIPRNVADRFLEAFDESLHAHTRLAYILCEHTGMRARESVQIRERQYHETERRIMLTPDQTKSKAGRMLPVNDVAHKALMECRKIGDYLWELLQEYPHLAKEYAEKYKIQSREDMPFILYRKNGTGVPRPLKHITTSAWKTVKKAVGANYRWHDTRAAFCSEALGASGDISAVQQIAGHQDITTTQRYLLASDARLKRAVNDLAIARPTEVPTKCLTKVSNKVEAALQQKAQTVENSRVSA
ncbi:MAG: tyrosine-type recombinase/integrase [Rhodospirillales bacterium]|nr:tyrosine-type recombinase/integrase [Rhodospirillales bacterium]MCB9994848.1 tyrosine-type recombinase/integrase [Rhodospirillales bacterium]